MSIDVPEIKLFPIRVHSQSESVGNIVEAVQHAVNQLMQNDRFEQLPAGSSIAVTAGSRGIANYVEILRHVVRQLQDMGHKPFLFSAMGSHGRGEAEGQKEVLDSMGITADAIGCPISCSSEVELISQFTAFGRQIPVYCAKEAIRADGVIVVNRVKPHTSFRGDYESGLLKMMAVGMGRASGADMFHSLGADYLADMIPLIGKEILTHAPIVGGIAVVENAKEETAIIEGVPYHKFFEREKDLLEQAKELMPSLPVERADLCIVGEMGKNYSGTGMDTNIIGRMRIQGVREPEKPFFTYLGVLRLSEPSHGNANGIGLADFTTEALVRSIDRSATYLNCVTSGFVIRAAIPMTFPTDRDLVNGALKMLRLDDPSKLRMVAIRNTLHIEHLWVTEAIYDEIKDRPDISLTDQPYILQFADDGSWIWGD